MATTLKKTNVVIVGLGAAGGIACLPLAQAGIEVVGLDAGPRLSTRDMAPDELRLSRNAWPPGPQKTDGEGPTFRPNLSSIAEQGVHPRMNAVGGTSIHYWAQSWRLNPWDFKVRSETIRRYGVSRIPRGSTVEDWPFDYNELEPYYEKVEYATTCIAQALQWAYEAGERAGPAAKPIRHDKSVEGKDSLKRTDELSAVRVKAGVGHLVTLAAGEACE